MHFLPLDKTRSKPKVKYEHFFNKTSKFNVYLVHNKTASAFGQIPACTGDFHPCRYCEHRGTSQLVTWSTRHSIKWCDELTVVCDAIVTS